ncbi:MAG: hypothetical protein KTR31_05390 [Myxococcales bacterium]|nr:hypothetical protein [Myxococcales bacterium]
MFRIFSDLGQVVTTLVPPWALPFVAGGFLLLLLLPWLESVRGKQIKGAIRRMVRAPESEHSALARRALDLAGTRRGRLIGLVQEAIRYGQHSLVKEGLARLEADPVGRSHAAKLRERIEKPAIRFRDPIEASVRIEGLLGEGLVVAAREQLDVALAHFPTDPELEALSRRVP